LVIGVKDNTRLDRYVGKNIIKAKPGQPGGNNKLHGENGPDLVLPVPVGTLITNTTTGQQHDVLDTQNSIRLLRGGQGGKGNTRFKSSTNQAPRQQTDGKTGEEGQFIFELRLIADAGLIGLPSAGKSTLLNFLTNAKSKVGEYDFTTLEPNLGTMHEFVLADIPGLIEGAASGKGLGHKFLQHITRTRVLLHCLSLESEQLQTDYETIRAELQRYDTELSKKPEQVILTKADKVTQEVIDQAKTLFPDAWVVSVLDDENMKTLRLNVTDLLGKHPSDIGDN
jgi:GTP-binding protein